MPDRGGGKTVRSAEILKGHMGVRRVGKRSESERFNRNSRRGSTVRVVFWIANLLLMAVSADTMAGINKEYAADLLVTEIDGKG